MFPETYAADSKALCRSDNGITPRAEFVGQRIGREVIPENCADCQFSKWNDKDAPPCALTDNWAVILPTGDPAILRLKGSSAKTSGMLKNIMRANRLSGRPTHVTLASVFRETATGSFYVSTVTPTRDPISPDALGTAKMLAGVNLAARAAIEQDEPASGRPVANNSNDEGPQNWDESETPF